MIKVFSFLLIWTIVFIPIKSSANSRLVNPIFLSGIDLLSSKAFLVIDKENGEVLLEQNSELLWNPASLTKLMTAVVYVNSSSDFGKIVSWSRTDEVGGSRIATKRGERFRCGDLLRATLIASANNAANMLWKCTDYSKEEFIYRMNQRAAEIGALQTRFVEPTGISEQNFSTAADMAKIAQEAFGKTAIANIASLSTYKFRSVGRPVVNYNLKNTNKLVFDPMMIVKAGKTGFIDESGYNLVTWLADINGKDLLVVLFGAKSHKDQFDETRKLAVASWLAFSWFK